LADFVPLKEALAPGDNRNVKRIAALVVLVTSTLGAVAGARAAAGAPARAGRTSKPGATSTTSSTSAKPSTSTSTTVPRPAFDAITVANVRADADWLLGAQMPDGAIGHYVDRVKIWPYLGNEAALGLARATEVTGDTKYVGAAWRWLQWYQAHQDAAGFVTDYNVVGGVETSTGDMDSTDAYAGTFLLAARKAWRASGSTATLGTLRQGVAKAVAAIEATQDVDGMTWAKPAWHVKYLMDQAETYAGLRAATDLAAALGDRTLAQQASGDANRMAAGVAGLWNGPSGAYDWAVHSTGARQATNWTLLYSDSLQQAWAVTYGLSTGTQAQGVITRFTTSQPKWANPTATALNTAGTGPVGYWPAAGLALQRTGQTAQAAVAATSIRDAALAAGRAWPFDSGVAGMQLLLESGDSSYLAG
jgi:hypothetical protein